MVDHVSRRIKSQYTSITTELQKIPKNISRTAHGNTTNSDYDNTIPSAKLRQEVHDKLYLLTKAQGRAGNGE